MMIRTEKKFFGPSSIIHLDQEGKSEKIVFRVKIIWALFCCLFCSEKEFFFSFLSARLRNRESEPSINGVCMDRPKILRIRTP